MSALALMAANENRWLTLSSDDVVIMSSHPIPGNEQDVTKVIDGLVRARRRGRALRHRRRARHRATPRRRSSRCSCRSCGPSGSCPVHGEYRHLVAHARLGRQMGVAADHVIVCEDGDQLVLDDEGLRPDAQVPAGYLYVDGIVGDVGNGVLRDRKVLAEEGVVVVFVGVDVDDRRHHHRAPRSSPAAGCTPPRPRTCSSSAPSRSRDAVKEAFQNDATDIENLQRVVRRAAGRFVNAQHQAPPDDRPGGDGGLTASAAPVPEGAPPAGEHAVDLYWIPLGSGAHVVRLSGRALRGPRPPRSGGGPVATSTTRPSRSWCRRAATSSRWLRSPRRGGERGVVAEGAVGSRLARSPPDLPLRGPVLARRVDPRRCRCGRQPGAGDRRRRRGPAACSTLTRSVPTAVWGRHELARGDMWNSNSVTSWLLTRAGVDIDAVRLPPGGRAPGWDAGIAWHGAAAGDDR